MSKELLPKEIRLNSENVSVIERAEAENDAKMIIEGYPVVFDKEAYIEGRDGGFYEKISQGAFDGADLSDVALKYNHNDNVFILARTRNGSLQLNPDTHGLFMRAELINTTTNEDVYKMVKSGLLTEGSFAFTVEDDKEEYIDGEIHRTVDKIGKLFDVAICPNGAYGDMTEIYARSYEALESVRRSALEKARHLAILKLRNANKFKFFGGQNGTKRVFRR